MATSLLAKGFVIFFTQVADPKRIYGVAIQKSKERQMFTLRAITRHPSISLTVKILNHIFHPPEAFKGFAGWNHGRSC